MTLRISHRDLSHGCLADTSRIPHGCLTDTLEIPHGYLTEICFQALLESSEPDSIFFTWQAFCPEGEVEGNGLLAFMHHVIFPLKSLTSADPQVVVQRYGSLHVLTAHRSSAMWSFRYVVFPLRSLSDISFGYVFRISLSDISFEEHSLLQRLDLCTDWLHDRNAGASAPDILSISPHVTFWLRVVSC